MSVYLREPGGVLFELATDGAGFGVDESPARLGGSLVLAPWLEPNRAAIEARLPKLGRTVGGFNDFAGGAMAEMNFQIDLETEQNKAPRDLCDAALKHQLRNSAQKHSVLELVRFNKNEPDFVS